MTYTDNKIQNDCQQLSGQRLVKLYEIDATALGGTVYRFVSSVDATNNVVSITPGDGFLTVVTSTPHTLSEADPVNISGVTPSNYNGNFVADSIVDTVTFTYLLEGVTADDDSGDAKDFFIFPTATFDQVGGGGASPPGSGDNMLLTRLNNQMVFNGNAYAPIALEATGFEWNGTGTLPQPEVQIGNVNALITGAVIALKDLAGAKFTRIRTFRKYLDDGSSPDPTATFPKDVYRINQKTAHTKVSITFQLASTIDQQGMMLPRRQCIRNTCTQTYRSWNGTEFVYTNATCPYTGTNYFDINGSVVTDPSKDVCGKHLTDCKLRFGATSPLPTRAFPGLGGAQ